MVTSTEPLILEALIEYAFSASRLPQAEPYLVQHPEQTNRVQERQWRIRHDHRLRCQPAVRRCHKSKSVVHLSCSQTAHNSSQSRTLTISAMSNRPMTTGSTPPSLTYSDCSRSSTSPSTRPVTHLRYTARLPPCGSVLTLNPPCACPARPSPPHDGRPCPTERDAGQYSLSPPFCSSVRGTYTYIL